MTVEPRRVGVRMDRSDQVGERGGPRGVRLPGTRRTFLVLAFGLVGGLAIGATNARAHSRLVKSDPSARAVLGAAPKEVRLWFNEPIEPAFAKTWLVPPDGAKVELANRGDASDKQLLIATIPDNVPQGPVVIAFRVLSVDGHVIEDKLVFTIKKSA